MVARLGHIVAGTLLAAVFSAGARAEGTPEPQLNADPAAIEFFEAKIRPLLAETCYECHGEKKQEGGLRLDSRAAFLAGATSGAIVAPGDPDASRIVSVVRYSGEIKMPPDMRLFPEEIDLITEWVKSGAAWPHEAEAVLADSGDAREYAHLDVEAVRASHWAFQPVRLPPFPEVSNDGWVRNPVDRFILAGLDARGLTPSPEADRRTLIRRLSHDLTGLPPTRDEVVAFENDPAPDAYENLVERLLASPHYGERWARHWLDVARYSDTKGYVFNQDRFFPFAYTYRDYVVREFNEDLPYDQFIVQQLAADQLDLGEDKRPLAAMGFLTLGRQFLGVEQDIIDDRIDVVTRGFMGLTVTCARCHEHKFDPIPAEDYYSLYGVFKSSVEPGELPLIEEPDPNDPLYQDYLRVLGEKEQEVDAYIKEVHVGLVKEAHERTADYLLGAHFAKGIEDNEAFLRLAKERNLNHQLLKRWVDFLKEKAAAPDPIFGAWGAYSAIPETDFAALAPGVPSALGVAANPVIAKAIETAPADMADVANRYGAQFTRVDQAWMRLVAQRAQLATETGAAPELPAALTDENDEALRQVMYAAGHPAYISLGDAFDLSEVPVRERITSMRNRVANHKATHPGRPDRAQVLADADEPFDPYVFLRGKKDNKGPEVPRRFLAVLSEGERVPFTHGSGRLDLAHAIASEDNPLTARVFVNRVWMQHFGRPLVGTPSDFGLRSDPPTHPELLDFLARAFMDGGWSVKDLQRLIVTSSAYRQASVNRPDAAEQDPENDSIWRQSRRRLDFESMRDAFIVAGGDFDATMGGPPSDMFGAPYLRRRALYGIIERQNLPGVLRAFDFAGPDTHAPLRYETTVPQQALYLMNSPFAIDQARRLAARAEGADADARSRRLFEIVYQRGPTPDELAMARAFLDRDFDDGPEPPPPSAWHYGFGEFDRLNARVTTFTPFGVFRDRQWRAGEKMPDDALGFLSLSERGGHPGRTADRSAIRRWVAPFDGAVRLSGRLRHGNENGDGVTGLVVSSAHGLLGEKHVRNDFKDIDFEQVSVRAGDTIDFVLSPGANDGYDSFEWYMRVKYVHIANEPEPYRLEWEARADFSGPPPAPPEPLKPWEQLAQVLLMSNEFMYVD